MNSLNDYSLISILKQLHKWRKPIVYVGFAAAVISATVSLIVPVYYESTTVFYAASEDLFKPTKVFGYNDSEIEYYGSTDDIQRILTVANSFELTDYLISEFGLYDHYDIDSSRSKASFKIRERLLDRYQVVRTKYDAIELTFEDRNPEMSAQLANAARWKIDQIVGNVIRESQKSIIDSYSTSIDIKEQIAKFNASMRDVKTGDVIILDFSEDKVDVSINEALIDSIEGESFLKALLAIWLGPKPPNEPLKKGILGG